ncbi:uncharacterized protein LOC100571019 [Acyrthosiphon pisum]|uniref:Uncharacterized protein n=1 Tax=Acyrthosiphon pisum TaxID=7029 RepID=A0A8R2NKN6_ACYPI|nr:uncharacterized protein LOC100571019 [Acyrthosiphon pisum]
MEQSKETSETMEVEDPCIVNKIKLTTPTFNFTSSNTRTSSSTGKKINVDISDAIYKLPFKHGWKRELVYRTSGQSTICNGDVYYYSPTNQKLRSLREIQEQLDILSDEDLTIESFTFIKKPIGINDRSKELIRDANSKLSKKDSFVGVAVRPKKSKTSVQRPPFDNELSDDENNKSSSKRKIVFKNTKSSARLKSKKGKSISESMSTSSSTPEYISEDCQATQSSVSPKVSSPKLEKIDITNTIIKIRTVDLMYDKEIDMYSIFILWLLVLLNQNNYVLNQFIYDRRIKCQTHLICFIDRTPIFKTEETHYEIYAKLNDLSRKNSEMNGSLRKIVTPSTSMQSFNYMAIALRHVFKYLKMDELLSASRVCTAWNIIAMNKTLWQNVCLKNSMVYDWERFVDSIDQQLTDTLDTRCMLMPSKAEDIESFWLRFARAMKRAQKLKFIELYRCPVVVVEDIISSLPQIEVLNATSIK